MGRSGQLEVIRLAAAACKLYHQYQTILRAEPPRGKCSNHGLRVVKMAWAEPSSRFTALKKLRWLEIQGSLERAVKRGL
jgi:hypothetical protein